MRSSIGHDFSRSGNNQFELINNNVTKTYLDKNHSVNNNTNNKKNYDSDTSKLVNPIGDKIVLNNNNITKNNKLNNTINCLNANNNTNHFNSASPKHSSDKNILLKSPVKLYNSLESHYLLLFSDHLCITVEISIDHCLEVTDKKSISELWIGRLEKQSIQSIISLIKSDQTGSHLNQKDLLSNPKSDVFDRIGANISQSEKNIFKQLDINRCLIIGWPTTNKIIEFENETTKQQWESCIRSKLKEEKSKEGQKGALIKVETKLASVTMCKMMQVRNDETCYEIVRRLETEMRIEEREFQMSVNLNGNNYFLIGHEIPFNIQSKELKKIGRSLLDKSAILDANILFVFKDKNNSINETNKLPTPTTTASTTEAANINEKSKKIKKFKRLFKKSRQYNSTFAKANMGSKFFGTSLSSLCDSKGYLPHNLRAMLDRLFVDGPNTNGVFRKTPNQGTMNQLVKRLDEYGVDDDTDYSNVPVILIGSIVKKFLRCLPECLLGDHLYNKWLDTQYTHDKNCRDHNIDCPKHDSHNYDNNILASNCDSNKKICICHDRRKHDDAVKVDTFKRLHHRLLPSNRQLLDQLLCCLSRIAENSSISQMNAQSLAICVGPSMLWKTSPTKDSLFDNSNKVTEMMGCASLDRSTSRSETQLDTITNDIDIVNKLVESLIIHAKDVVREEFYDKTYNRLKMFIKDSNKEENEDFITKDYKEKVDLYKEKNNDDDSFDSLDTCEESFENSRANSLDDKNSEDAQNITTSIIPETVNESNVRKSYNHDRKVCNIYDNIGTDMFNNMLFSNPTSKTSPRDINKLIFSKHNLINNEVDKITSLLELPAQKNDNFHLMEKEQTENIENVTAYTSSHKKGNTRNNTKYQNISSFIADEANQNIRNKNNIDNYNNHNNNEENNNRQHILLSKGMTHKGSDFIPLKIFENNNIMHKDIPKNYKNQANINIPINYNKHSRYQQQKQEKPPLPSYEEAKKHLIQQKNHESIQHLKPSKVSPLSTSTSLLSNQNYIHPHRLQPFKSYEFNDGNKMPFIAPIEPILKSRSEFQKHFENSNLVEMIDLNAKTSSLSFLNTTPISNTSLTCDNQTISDTPKLSSNLSVTAPSSNLLSISTKNHLHPQRNSIHFPYSSPIRDVSSPFMPRHETTQSVTTTPNTNNINNSNPIISTPEKTVEKASTILSTMSVTFNNNNSSSDNTEGEGSKKKLLRRRKAMRHSDPRLKYLKEAVNDCNNNKHNSIFKNDYYENQNNNKENNINDNNIINRSKSDISNDKKSKYYRRYYNKDYIYNDPFSYNNDRKDEDDDITEKLDLPDIIRDLQKSFDKLKQNKRIKTIENEKNKPLTVKNKLWHVELAKEYENSNNDNINLNKHKSNREVNDNTYKKKILDTSSYHNRPNINNFKCMASDRNKLKNIDKIHYIPIIKSYTSGYSYLNQNQKKNLNIKQLDNKHTASDNNRKTLSETKNNYSIKKPTEISCIDITNKKISSDKVDKDSIHNLKPTVKTLKSIFDQNNALTNISSMINHKNSSSYKKITKILG